MERQNGEKEDARASAVLVLQAGYRGMRERKKVNLRLRHEFQTELSQHYTIDVLERQMMRINYFFDTKFDVLLMCQLAEDMLILKDQLIVHILQDERSMLRLRLILEKALLILSEPQPSSGSTILNLLETFTDWNEMDSARLKLAPVSDSSRTEEVIANLWSHLVLQKDFFDRYTNLLIKSIVIHDHYLGEWCKNLEEEKGCFFNIYKHLLEFVRRLTCGYRKFRIAKNAYSTKELVQTLLLKLAESLSRGILRQKGESIPNDFFRFVVLPMLGKEMGVPNKGISIFMEYWIDVVWVQSQLWTFPDHDMATSIKLRPVMYSFLIMVRYSEQWHSKQGIILNVINRLLKAIENRRQLFKMPDEDDIRDVFFDNIKLKTDEETEAALDFFNDRTKIYKELEIVLNNMQLQFWISDFTAAKWSLMYPLMSCIIEMQPMKAAIHFRFLSVLYNKPSFMRSICIHVMRKENKCKVELVVVCWMLRQLMKILHDDEFLDGIPLNVEEFQFFIRLLEDTYTDIVLSDKDVRDKQEKYFKKEMAQTLMAIHDRNTRINIYSEDVFLSTKFSVVFPMETHGIKFRDFYNTYISGTGTLSLLDQRLLRVLNDFPFALSFHDRVSIWHQILHTDHVERHIVDNPLGRQHIQIRRSYIYEDAYDKLSSENVPDLRSDVRISLVNVVGVEEAGVDGGGLLREFLTEATKAGVDPNRGLFRVDSENRIYPNPIAKRIYPDYMKHFFFMGRLVGKALYRQILLEFQLTAFFMQLATFGSISSAVDYLATLDPDLHKNLLKLKSFDGDWSELGLDFTIASDEFGEAKVVELKPDGRNIAVDRDNVIEYIHLVSDYKINREIMEECRWFSSGLHDVVPVLRIFSWKEMQTLISGSDKPINVEDWKENTNYAGGYSATHNTIEMFWQVVEHFDEEYLRKLLKFVTSCSRPPLLGFKDLVPKFGISNAGVTDRLPTAATCVNLLKLPEFADIDTLRERLVYAINAQAGFELS